MTKKIIIIISLIFIFFLFCGTVSAVSIDSNSSKTPTTKIITTSQVKSTVNSESSSNIIVHAHNPEGVEIASIKEMPENCVLIYDGNNLISYGVSNYKTHNKPIPISSGYHDIIVKFNGMTKNQKIFLKTGETKSLVFIFNRTEFPLIDVLKTIKSGGVTLSRTTSGIPSPASGTGTLDQNYSYGLYGVTASETDSNCSFKPYVYCYFSYWTSASAYGKIECFYDVYNSNFSYYFKAGKSSTEPNSSSYCGGNYETGVYLSEVPLKYTNFTQWYTQSITEGIYPRIRVWGTGGRYDYRYLVGGFSNWAEDNDYPNANPGYHLDTAEANKSYTQIEVHAPQSGLNVTNYTSSGYPELFGNYKGKLLELKMSSVPYDIMGTGVKTYIKKGFTGAVKFDNTDVLKNFSNRRVYVTLVDNDLNLNKGSKDKTIIQAYSYYKSGSTNKQFHKVDVSLTETGISTGIFKGFFIINSATDITNGGLKVIPTLKTNYNNKYFVYRDYYLPEGMIKLVYYDKLDAEGNIDQRRTANRPTAFYSHVAGYVEIPQWNYGKLGNKNYTLNYTIKRISGVDVWIIPNGEKTACAYTKTNSAGMYQINYLKPGKYTAILAWDYHNKINEHYYQIPVKLEYGNGGTTIIPDQLSHWNFVKEIMKKNIEILRKEHKATQLIVDTYGLNLIVPTKLNSYIRTAFNINNNIISNYKFVKFLTKIKTYSKWVKVYNVALFGIDKAGQLTYMYFDHVSSKQIDALESSLITDQPKLCNS